VDDDTTARAARTNALRHALRHAPVLRLSRIRLVFGPSESVAPVLRAVADALEPVGLEPTELRCSIGADGCRLRVTCDIDPSRPDLARVLGHLLRRRNTERAVALARSA
jgi:hypothetical protein